MLYLALLLVSFAHCEARVLGCLRTPAVGEPGGSDEISTHEAPSEKPFNLEKYFDIEGLPSLLTVQEITSLAEGETEEALLDLHEPKTVKARHFKRLKRAIHRTGLLEGSKEMVLKDFASALQDLEEYVEIICKENLYERIFDVEIMNDFSVYVMLFTKKLDKYTNVYVKTINALLPDFPLDLETGQIMVHRYLTTKMREHFAAQSVEHRRELVTKIVLLKERMRTQQTLINHRIRNRMRLDDIVLFTAYNPGVELNFIVMWLAACDMLLADLGVDMPEVNKLWTVPSEEGAFKAWMKGTRTYLSNGDSSLKTLCTVLRKASCAPLGSFESGIAVEFFYRRKLLHLQAIYEDAASS